MITQNIYMEEALKEAKKAQEQNEVPIGAVIVINNIIIYKAHNLTITNKDATAHAEIIAIRESCKILNNERLTNASLYVTLEPCIMCFGAILHARIKNLYFGAYDKKNGVSGSPLFNYKTSNLNIYGGIYEQECKELLVNFFKDKR